MVVFSQRCLPLTSNLRPLADGLKGPESNIADSEAEKYGIDHIYRSLIRAIRKGSREGEFSWDYDYDSLWSPRLRGPKGRVNIWKCSKETYIGILRTRTYWYKRLPKAKREKVKLLSNSSSGRRKIKDYMDTTDGILLSLIFSFPEMFANSGGYTLSDRIINSSMCNCLSSYSDFQAKVKSLRKKIKGCFLRQEVASIDFGYLRDLSYMVLPIKLFNANCNMTSKSWIFRLAMFSQTRASGLVGAKKMKSTLDEFIRTAQTPVDYSPNELLLKCIDQVTTSLAEKIHLGTNHSFRISMSTSACRESPRSKEGKFGYLKTLVRERGIKIPPLLEGKGGTLGDPLWTESILRRMRKDPTTMNVNVAVIRENAKPRVVTSGSFWKETALQPFSHITIQLIKTLRHLRNGLSAGRLGWRFISQVEYTQGDEGGLNWIFEKENKKDIRLYTSDWKMATDGPMPQSGRDLTGSLLRKTGLDPTILKVILDYWVGEKIMHVKGKPVGKMVRGIPMGDPLTKTNLSLAHPVCDLYAIYKTHSQSFVNGNGDDLAVITNSEEYGHAYQEAATMLGYQRSSDDEVISKCWGTYCEEYFHLPVSKVNTCKWGTRFKNSLLLPYLDVPKLRCMIATEKDRADFSSDPRGKTTLLGHDEEYLDVNDPGPLKHIYAIAAGFQDVSLALIDQPTPLYLPRQVNGLGRPPSYWSVDSWMRILSRCKSWHKKYYLRVFYEYTHGLDGVTTWKGALKESNHFQKEMMVEIQSIPEDNPVKKWVVVEQDEWDLYPDGLLEKLITTNYLIPESKISKYYLMQIRLMTLEQDQPQVDLFECIKSKMVSYPDLPQEMERDLVSKFVDLYKSSPFRLKTDRREPLYDSDILRILDEGSPLSVGVTRYPLLRKFEKPMRPDTLYQKNAEDLYTWFKGARMFVKSGQPADSYSFRLPTDILDDDPQLIRRIERERDRYDCFVLISDDNKLARLVWNKFPDVVVFRMNCSSYFQSLLWLRENDLMSDIPGEMDHGDLEDVLLDSLLNDGDDIEEEVVYDMHLRALFREHFGQQANLMTLFDKGNIESHQNKFNEDESGMIYQTIGIPWSKNISNRNMERKPLHGSLHKPRPRSFQDLGFPQSLVPESAHRHLRRQLLKKKLRGG
jgi:hypothetical protein